MRACHHIPLPFSTSSLFCLENKTKWGKRCPIRPANWTRSSSQSRTAQPSEEVRWLRAESPPQGRNANKCSKIISYLLAFFIFDFAVLPLFNFSFPTDPMDLVSSSSLVGSSYVKATKMLLNILNTTTK